MAEYIALIRKEDGTDYGVSFPDFPGCVTAGSSMDEALRAAEEALALHVEGMREDGEKIPAPSLLDTIARDKSHADATAVVVRGPSEKAVRVNITLEEALLDAIDRYVARTDFTGGRSGLIAAAAKQMIGLAGHREEPVMFNPGWTIMLDETTKAYKALLKRHSNKSRPSTDVIQRCLGYSKDMASVGKGRVFVVRHKEGAMIIEQADAEETERAIDAYMVPQATGRARAKVEPAKPKK